MPPLAERQRHFATALLDPDRPMPAGLVGPDGEPSERRFNVYRNNVMVGLAQTLKDAYPAVHRIVGADFFQAMARAYAARELPRSPIMLDYGAGFPEFIRGFDPAAGLPYLADVASIERAWTEAYHAAEALPIDPESVAAIEPAETPALRLVLHPSVRTVRSPFPALTIWQMNAAGGVPAPVDVDAGGEAALVIRPEADVEVRSIPGSCVDFIRAVADGKSVLDAVKKALCADPRFDLAAALHDLLHAGAVVGISPKAEPEPA